MLDALKLKPGDTATDVGAGGLHEHPPHAANRAGGEGPRDLHVKPATENGKKERVFPDDGDRRGRAMANPIDHQQFLALLSARFPNVAADMDESVRGLLHCEMGTFARATNAAIRVGDVATVRCHFRFADEVLRDAAPNVRNAIAASYLETLALCGRHARRIEARRLLTPRLGQTLTESEEDLAQRYEGEAEGDG